MTVEQQPTDQTKRAPSRRTVAKGAAWAAPVLTGAALAPSIAASPTQACTGARPATVSYSIGANQTDVPFYRSAAGQVRRGYYVFDLNRRSVFPTTVTICSAASSPCTIPAGTALVDITLQRSGGSLITDNTKIATSLPYTLVSDTVSGGYRLRLRTATALAPGACVSTSIVYYDDSLAGFTLPVDYRLIASPPPASLVLATATVTRNNLIRSSVATF